MLGCIEPLFHPLALSQEMCTQASLTVENFTFIVLMSSLGLWSSHIATSVGPCSRNNLFDVCSSQKSVFSVGENKSYLGT